MSACGAKPADIVQKTVIVQHFDDPRVTNGDLPDGHKYPEYQAGYVAEIQRSDGTVGEQTWYWGPGEGDNCVTVNKLTVKIVLQAPAGFGWKQVADMYCKYKL